MEEPYYTPEEVAQLLRVSTRTVYSALRSGRMPSYRPFGRWRISANHLEQFLTGVPNAPEPVAPALPVAVAVAPPRPIPVPSTTMSRADRRRQQQGRK